MHNRHELEKMRGGVPFARVIEFTRAVLMAGADDVTIDLKRGVVQFRFTLPCREPGRVFELGKVVSFVQIEQTVMPPEQLALHFDPTTKKVTGRTAVESFTPPPFNPGPVPSFSVKVGGVEKLKQPSLDEPVPVRLTLTGLAKAFEDACSEVAIQEGVLDHALQLRAKARKALDNAADRLANGDA